MNLSELRLRQVAGEGRAAAKARPELVKQLQEYQIRLGHLQQLEEEIWLAVPSAAAHLFHAAKRVLLIADQMRAEKRE